MSKNTSMPPPDQSPDTEGIAPLPDLRKRGRLMEPNPSIRVSINPFIPNLKALMALLALCALVARTPYGVRRQSEATTTLWDSAERGGVLCRSELNTENLKLTL